MKHDLLPPHEVGNGRPRRYPWAHMEVGDYFDVPAAGVGESAIRSAVHAQNSMSAGWRFVAVILPSCNTRRVMRVW